MSAAAGRYIIIYSTIQVGYLLVYGMKLAAVLAAFLKCRTGTDYYNEAAE